jgi:glycosyltransferase involved in cell wall biosynthesis
MLNSFAHIIQEIKPDIIHAHQITDISLFPASTNFHPFVVTPWGSDVLIAPKKSIISRRIAQFVMARADLITCDADHMVDSISALGIKRDKVKIIYFGTDIDRFKPECRDASLREQLGVTSPCVISLRHLEPIYNVESLIIAAPFILQEFPETKVLIVGKGSEESKLRKLAFSLRVQDNIVFLGSIHSQDMPRYLASADIYVSTSLSDAGLAASTAEAMSCGLAPVITDFRDNSKWVNHEINGYLVPCQYPFALASRIINLIRDNGLRIQYGTLSRKVIMQRNNWATEMAKMGRLYGGLIE